MKFKKLFSALIAGAMAATAFMGAMPGIVPDHEEMTASASGESLSLSSAEGIPGETVTLSIKAACRNNLESLDIVVNWDDKKLTSSLARGVGGGIKSRSDAGSGYCSLVAYSDSAIEDGTIATIDFTIPKDAKPGKVYDIYFGTVDHFGIWDGDDLENSVPKHGGTITVAAPAEEITTAASETASTTTTTTTTTAVTVSKSGNETSSQTTPAVTTKISDGDPTLSMEQLEMQSGDKLHLKVNNYGGAVKWTSSDDKVAAVDENGNVTAVGEGSAVIYALFDKTSLTCEVTVEKGAVTAVQGDSNGDGKLNVRDAANIAAKLALGKANELPAYADFNGDGKVNVRDAAAIAKFLATGKK